MNRDRLPRWRRCRSWFPVSTVASVPCERHRWHTGKHQGAGRMWSHVPEVIGCSHESGGVVSAAKCTTLAVPGYTMCLVHLRREVARRASLTAADPTATGR